MHNNQAWSNSSGLWRQSFAMLSCVGLLVILIASEKKFLLRIFYVQHFLFQISEKRLKKTTSTTRKTENDRKQ